ncbi:MAG: hypothetical protein ACJ74H_07615 [Thermoanaerobaculia bacterium]
MIRNATTAILLALVLGGALVRLAARRQTFFGDEMWVLEFVAKGEYLPHSIPQPPLFFYSAVAASGICGMGEGCLRAPAEIAAVLLTLMPFVVWRTTRVLKPAGAIVWTTILAFSSPLSFYAARAKQYSLEALGCAVVLWLFLRALEDERRWRTFAVVSAFLVATLHSPIFVLAATALASGRKKRAVAIHIGLAALFALAYFGYMRPGSEVTRYFGDLEEYFTADLPAFWDGSPVFAITQTRLWIAQMLNLTRALAAILGIAILAWIWRRRDAPLAISTLGPIVLVLLASALRLYPYGEVRLMIFLLPGLSLAFALAIQTFDNLPVIATAAVLLALFVVRGVRDDPYNTTYMHVDDLRRTYERLRTRPEIPVVVRSFDVRPLRHYVPAVNVLVVPPRATEITVGAPEYWTLFRDHEIIRVSPPGVPVEELRQGRMRLVRVRAGR